MNRWPKLAVLSLIFAAPMAMLYPLWSNPVSAGEDDVVYYYPLRKMAGQSLREGHWPVSNPYEATGIPLLADPQAAVMHPATWLFAALDAKSAYSISIFAAFWIAGFGAYAYLRKLALLRPAAAFGALAFMFCGFMVGHRVHLATILGAAMLPWGLWCLETLRTRRVLAFATLVPVVFLTLASGHWPTFIYISIIWTGYYLLRCRPIKKTIFAAFSGAVMGLAMAGPQLLATYNLLVQASRQRIGYSQACENSFHPACSLLAFFPMLMGSRTPGFYPDAWWGPWHLCEMLGYVGLSTLVLAGAAIWKLYRKRPAHPALDANVSAPGVDDSMQILRPLVRAWTWLLFFAGLWMLGKYLPTYQIVHSLPVLGVIRCPARMVLAADMGLATLSAIAIHLVLLQSTMKPETPSPLFQTIRRCASRTLPITMAAMLAIITLLTVAIMWLWSGDGGFQNLGTPRTLYALRPWNPGLFIPVVMCAATAWVISWWLKLPCRRWPALAGLLLADLFFVARFVDVPPAGAIVPDPEASPAAAWLAQNAPKEKPTRVWGLSRDYHDRPAELLLPKTSAGLGVASIASYGPWQSPNHAHLLEFQITGENRAWARMIRQNYLLSLYNVRYILTAEPKFRDVIESVKTPRVELQGQLSRETHPNLLRHRWRVERAELRDNVFRLQTSMEWLISRAWQQISPLTPGRLYRISLVARAAEGAAGYVRAEAYQVLDSGRWVIADEMGLTIPPDQIGPEPRRFEWTFRAPQDQSGEILFRLFSPSERMIEITGLDLREADGWEEPVLLSGGKLPPGSPVYRLAAQMPATDPSAPPVAIYENLLCRDEVLPQTTREWPHKAIEELKWSPQMFLEETMSVTAASQPAAAQSSHWHFNALLRPEAARLGQWDGPGPIPGCTLKSLPRVGLVSSFNGQTFWKLTGWAGGIYLAMVLGGLGWIWLFSKKRD